MAHLKVEAQIWSEVLVRLLSCGVISAAAFVDAEIPTLSI